MAETASSNDWHLRIARARRRDPANHRYLTSWKP